MQFSVLIQEVVERRLNPMSRRRAGTPLWGLRRTRGPEERSPGGFWILGSGCIPGPETLPDRLPTENAHTTQGTWREAVPGKEARWKKMMNWQKWEEVLQEGRAAAVGGASAVEPVSSQSALPPVRPHGGWVPSTHGNYVVFSQLVLFVSWTGQIKYVETIKLIF